MKLGNAIKKYMGLEFLKKSLNTIKIEYALLDENQEKTRVNYLENTRVANNSVVFKGWRVLKNTIIYQDRFDHYNRLRFLIKYIIPSFPFARKNIIYLNVADEWCKNYCHWIFDALTKLIVLRRSYPESVVILPKSYLKIEFVVKSLEAFGIRSKNIITINKKSNLKVPKLGFIECVNNTNDLFGFPNYYNFLEFQEIRKTILTHFSKDFRINFGDKIYISRNNPKKSGMRRITNHQKVDDLLKKHGFKTVYMEDYDFLDQVSIASYAKYIVSPHGAGITNALFIKNDGILLELVDKNWINNCFEEMSKRIGIGYIRQNCKPQDENKAMIVRDIIVDLEELEKNLLSFK